jgi:hypothetical protein
MEGSRDGETYFPYKLDFNQQLLLKILKKKKIPNVREIVDQVSIKHYLADTDTKFEIILEMPKLIVTRSALLDIEHDEQSFFLSINEIHKFYDKEFGTWEKDLETIARNRLEQI